MTRGGKRAGAGRPKGTGKYQESTKTIRIPVSRESDVLATLAGENEPLSVPLYSSKVQAGFPSPADDYIERYLDLNAEYIKHPSATFLVTATGESMIDAGIFEGDVLLVDKSLQAVDGSIVIAALNGELTVKRLSRKKERVQLVPANPKFQPIDITEEQDVVIWGVVTLVLHRPV
ncbi:LexA family transcriptional regulator [uncultured Legionella sp.]|uniref:LexA family protein n=1 Tax=uncultured Legionella sp. TaxID=210934 RepID=UPI00261C1D5B|nr:translesion error-prone DNA polymerase V autoproteolytic subunit [uncultured Legionella sp.]